MFGGRSRDEPLNLRRIMVVGGVVGLFLPSCLVLYSLASSVIGTVAQPVVAPRPPTVVIDHFHIEGFVEAAFLGLCLVLPLNRRIVWCVAALMIPLVPHLVLELANPMPSLPGPSFAQDFTLWSLEAVGAGVLSCVLWDGTRRVLERGRPIRDAEATPPTDALQRTRPAQATEPRRWTRC
jgi:hypothetical protein